MKKIYLLPSFLVITLTSFAQSGPGGVGNSINNVLWLKADAGTNTNTDGGSISLWKDQSGNNINPSQSTIVQQPIFRNNIMNGNPAIEFDNNNIAGQNDMLKAADNALLDNTSGYTFFTVSRMKNLDGSARSIVSKRTAVDTDEAFMLFYYTNNYFNLDIDGLGNRFDGGAPAFTNNNNYIIDAVYDGSLASANRSSIYEGETLRKTATESSALVPDKNSPLVVGATHGADNRAFGGYISEIIIYRTVLNPASRIIVNNYLSAKYNIALSANNNYAGDDPMNGNYDLQVAGIGQESTGSNVSFSSSISGGLGMSSNSGLDNGDYILAGHALPVNAEITTDVGGMSGTNNARWQRIWYFDITNSTTTINNTITFNTTDGGLGMPLGNTSDYVLLYRPGQSGNWSELSTANSVIGNDITFNNQYLTNDGYYTLGLKNYTNTPLPVVFTSFNGKINNSKVTLNWSTGNEKNNSYFTIERSKDGIHFNDISKVNGAGSSNSSLSYSFIDHHAYSGISYYRIRQTDTDGTSTNTNTIAIHNNEGAFDIYPNPSVENETIYMNLPDTENKEVLVIVRDIHGSEHYSKVIIDTNETHLVALNPSPALAPGIYIIVASSDQTTYSKKIIVK